MGSVEPYHLAIDLGTSRIAAAISRLGPDGHIHTATFALGRRGDTVATVAFVGEDGSILFGDAAERRGISEPERLIREFKRSIGDDVPFLVAGRAIAPEALYADTVASVVDAVSEREGALPAGIVLTHPVAWGAHRLGLVQGALAAVGLGAVELITEPEAAARHYEAERPLQDGQAVAVYDLGGGTFDAVVLRREAGGGFRIAGQPEGIPNLGGADFDDLVMRHAIGTADVDPEHLTVERDDSRLALAQLRRECVEAKEALSYDSDVTIPVLLPSGSPSVRLTRSEFESMIDADVTRTVDALDDALASAGIEAADLDCILLIGGSSRIPLVTERLSERFDRPLAIDADPKSSIALGAALTGLVRAHDRALGVEALAIAQPAAAIEAVDAAPPVTPSAPVHAPSTGERVSRGRVIALAAGTFFFIGAVVFSTGQAAGLRLDSPMSSAIDKAVSALVGRSADEPTSSPVAAGVDQPLLAAPDPSQPAVESPRAKSSAPERTTTPTPTTRSDQPATSKTAGEMTPAVPVSAAASPSTSSSEVAVPSSSPSSSSSPASSPAPSIVPSSPESSPSTEPTTTAPSSEPATTAPSETPSDPPATTVETTPESTSTSEPTPEATGTGE